MPNTKLINFIKKAKAKGYEDFQIRQILLNYKRSSNEIELAFLSLKQKEGTTAYKNKVTIYLDNKLLKILEKRADKNMLNLHEQIEEILRRSVLNMKTTNTEEKLDDKFVGLFSRKRR